MILTAQLEFIPELLKMLATMTPGQALLTMIFIVVLAAIIYFIRHQKTEDKKVTSEGKIRETEAATEAEAERVYGGIMTKVADMAFNSTASIERVTGAYEASARANVEAIQSVTLQLMGVKNSVQEELLTSAEAVAHGQVMEEYILHESAATRKLLQTTMRDEFKPLLERAIGVESRVALILEILRGKDQAETPDGLLHHVIELDRRMLEMYDLIINLMEQKENPHEAEAKTQPDRTTVTGYLHRPQPDPATASAGTGGDRQPDPAGGGTTDGGSDRHAGGDGRE